VEHTDSSYLILFNPYSIFSITSLVLQGRGCLHYTELLYTLVVGLGPLRDFGISLCADAVKTFIYIFIH